MGDFAYPWLYSNVQISYPFVPEVYPRWLKKVFVDAYIVDGTNLRVDVEPIDEPLELVLFEMASASSAGLIQLQYVHDGSLFFFDNTPPTTKYTVWDFGPWKVVAADNATERKFFRIVLNTQAIPGYPFELSFELKA